MVVQPFRLHLHKFDDLLWCSSPLWDKVYSVRNFFLEFAVRFIPRLLDIKLCYRYLSIYLIGNTLFLSRTGEHRVFVRPEDRFLLYTLAVKNYIKNYLSWHKVKNVWRLFLISYARRKYLKILTTREYPRCGHSQNNA